MILSTNFCSFQDNKRAQNYKVSIRNQNKIDNLGILGFDVLNLDSPRSQ